MRLLYIVFCVAVLAGCSRQPSTPPAALHWYSLRPNERLVTEISLASQQATNIVIQSSGKIVLGFKSDVPVSYAAQNRDTYITLRSTNTFGRVSSGIGAATRFDGSPDGIHLEVSSDFSFPVRVAIYQETTP